MLMEKELLRKLGEETIYTAKGHFKAGDIRRQLTTITIWGCTVLNVLGLFDIHPILSKCFTAVGIFGTIALLIWNEGEGKDYRIKHKSIAEKYLALHKEIRDCYFLATCSPREVEELSQKVRQLDREEKPEIPFAARKAAKKAIEKKNPEIDTWFLNL
jgi:hypothetical protein